MLVRISIWGIFCLLQSTWLLTVSAVNTEPRQSDGFTDLVQWDSHSFFVNGERLFLFTGEMHYWRIPVPEMWRDILEKIKAAGFTGFTFYSSWQWHSFNSTSTDFETGAHDITRLYQMAEEIGLYVLLRPGPYINAEANAGGFALWLMNGEYGALRDNNPKYAEAYTPYIEKFVKLSLPHLITRGGNGIMFQIENEIKEWIGDPLKRNPNQTIVDYMVNLEKIVRESGIDVPLYANNPGTDTKSWSVDFAPGEPGNTDVSGLDNYPSCYTCNVSECGNTVTYQVSTYYDYFALVNPNTPSFIPEFQGGAFNPWSGPKGGCPNNIGEDYANMFYRHNIAEGVTAMNLYMMYGGTNWGSFAEPGVATSYDYSSPISEDRSLGDKYYETKLLALFTRATQHDLSENDRITNSTLLTTNPAILTTELRNPSSNAAFYVTIHNDSTSATLESFKLHVNTSEGHFTIPKVAQSIVLNGHQSKVIPTDFSMTNMKAKLVYSTAEILTTIVTDDIQTIFLWVPTEESAEFYLSGVHGGISEYQSHSTCESVAQNAENGVIVSLSNVRGFSVFVFSGKSSNGYMGNLPQVRVVVMDRPTAHLTWAPTLTKNPFGLANESIVVQGPYLVRGASLKGHTLHLTGDSNRTSNIEVFASTKASSITWNGQRLHTSISKYLSLKATIPGPQQTFNLPGLTGWRVADSLPEKDPSYDASGIAWIVADHKTTANPTKPITLPVLYGDDYGFHAGSLLWRGIFQGKASGVRITVEGGRAHGWSAWLNGVFLDSFLGNATYLLGNEGSLTLYFPQSALEMTGENSLLIVHDNMGHDEQPDYLHPRGILEATLLDCSIGHSFREWKVAGSAGGSHEQLDPIRGPLAEGGLYGERLGWHLPGFDDSTWKEQSPAEPSSKYSPGISFYRTVVPLHVPQGLDVSVSFVLGASGTQKLRAQLYVNGYQYARFSPWIGHQVEFPVPPGILDYDGDNTIALTVWGQAEEAPAVDVDWQVNYAVESNLDTLFDGAYLRPEWDSRRLAYA